RASTPRAARSRRYSAAPRPPGRADEQRGLHGAYARSVHHARGLGAGEDRMGGDIRHDDARAGLDRRAAGAVVVVHSVEELEERFLEAALGDDVQAVVQLELYV